MDVLEKNKTKNSKDRERFFHLQKSDGWGGFRAGGPQFGRFLEKGFYIVIIVW